MKIFIIYTCPTPDKEIMNYPAIGFLLFLVVAVLLYASGMFGGSTASGGSGTGGSSDPDAPSDDEDDDDDDDDDSTGTAPPPPPAAPAVPPAKLLDADFVLTKQFDAENKIAAAVGPSWLSRDSRYYCPSGNYYKIIVGGDGKNYAKCSDKEFQ